MTEHTGPGLLRQPMARLRALRRARKPAPTLVITLHPEWRKLLPSCTCPDDTARYTHFTTSSPAIPLVTAETPNFTVRPGMWIQLKGVRGATLVNDVAALEYDHYVFRMTRYVDDAPSEIFVAIPSRAAKAPPADRFRFENRKRQLPVDKALWQTFAATPPLPGFFGPLVQADIPKDIWRAGH